MISFLGTVDTGLLYISVFVQNVVDMIIDYALWVTAATKLWDSNCHHVSRMASQQSPH